MGGAGTSGACGGVATQRATSCSVGGAAAKMIRGSAGRTQLEAVRRLLRFEHGQLGGLQQLAIASSIRPVAHRGAR